MSMSTQVDIETSKGMIRVELDEAKAPISSKNFLEYVDAGHYDGTIFHRVIPGFMIQGGGFEPGMRQKATRATIANEANNGLKNDRYTLAMARTSAPHSASSQFFINLADNSLLDTAPYGPYAVFATVDAGSTALVQSMTTAPCVLDPTDLPAGDCLPAPNIVITSATQTQ
jgi:peptidyl-prolyl cis-trans isomerase B (cyclophilin B)